MTALLAGALLSLVQGPYSPATASDPPANAPVWIAGQAEKEHSFAVTAEFECPTDTVGGFLQVSISDTTVRAQFGAEEKFWRRVLSLQVPSEQLKGLRPKLFCPEPAAFPGPVLRLESRFTGQGALVCRNAAGKRTTTQTSVALDAWVRCPPVPPERPTEPDGVPTSNAPGNEGVPALDKTG